MRMFSLTISPKRGRNSISYRQRDDDMRAVVGAKELLGGREIPFRYSRDGQSERLPTLDADEHSGDLKGPCAATDADPRDALTRLINTLAFLLSSRHSSAHLSIHHRHPRLSALMSSVFRRVCR